MAIPDIGVIVIFAKPVITPTDGRILRPIRSCDIVKKI
jgi:hypothetical protein